MHKRFVGTAARAANTQFQRYRAFTRREIVAPNYAVLWPNEDCPLNVEVDPLRAFESLFTDGAGGMPTSTSVKACFVSKVGR